MKTSFLIPAFLLIFLACKKHDAEPELPAETQVGANTFGCRFNGRAWIPEADEKPLNNCTDLRFEFEPYRDSGFFSFTATNCKQGGYVSINADIAGKTGIYPIGDLDSTYRSLILAGDKCTYESGEPDTYCQGSITFTRVDYRAGIVSGRFAFVIHKPGCDTLKVTDGRFDLKTN